MMGYPTMEGENSHIWEEYGRIGGKLCVTGRG